MQGLVQSRLDGTNAFFLGLPPKWVKKIQITQTHAARLVYNCAHREHVTPVLRSLHWLPRNQRVKFKILCFFHRAYWQYGPKYLSRMALHYEPTRNLRSASLNQAVPLPSRLQFVGGRLMQSEGACLWNSLPPEMRSIATLMQFRRKLKTWLFSKAYG